MKNSMDFSASVKDALTRVTIRDQAFIGGRYVPAASGETFECRTPIDGSLLTKIAACGEADAEAAAGDDGQDRKAEGRGRHEGQRPAPLGQRKDEGHQKYRPDHLDDNRLAKDATVKHSARLGIRRSRFKSPAAAARQGQ